MIIRRTSELKFPDEYQTPFDTRLIDNKIWLRDELKKLRGKAARRRAGPFPIPSNKYTNPGIKDQLRTLYGTLEEFYLISHRIKNPEWNSRFTDTNQNP